MPAFTFIPGDTIQWAAVLIDAAAKGLVVLLPAAGATLLLRRSSAAVRHMTWTLSIAALILVPFLSLALPQLQVPLLPDWAGTGRQARIRQPAPSPLTLPAQWPGAGQPPVGTGGLGAEPIMPAGDWPSPAGARQPLHPADAAPETPAAPVPAAAAPQPPPVHWPAWVLLAWLAGAAALLLPLLAGTIIVWRQARRAERINSGSWVHLLDELRPRLGVRGRVVLLRSNWPNIPLTCGVFRPAIILPAEADNWPADRRRVVLLHELAHIRRRDCLTQLLARLARVIYWFNPLVWLAGRMLRIEREQACDDLVLASGHKASDYAQHLLDIVGSLRSVRCPSLAAVAMARKSQFEGRLLAILDPRRNRRTMSRLGILIAAVLAAAFIVPLAVLKATAPEKPAAADDQAPAGPARVSPAPIHQATPATSRPTTQPAGSKLEFRIAPSASSLTNAERDSYMDWLKAGKIDFWWKGGRIRGRMPDPAWLPFAGDMANAGNLVTGEYNGQKYVLVSDKPGQTMVTGEGKEAWGLAKAYATTDSMNQPAVGFELDDRGAELFSAFTKANINNTLAIVVDGKVVFAPRLMGALGKQGMITGRFSEQEVQALVKALKAGPAPAPNGASTQPATQPALHGASTRPGD